MCSHSLREAALGSPAAETEAATIEAARLASKEFGKVFRDIPSGFQTSATVVKFANGVRDRMCYQCMATQDAIDRIAAEFRGGRQGFLELLCSAQFTRGHLYAYLAEGAWKEVDIHLASGRTRDWWLGMIDGESRILHAVYGDVDAIPKRVSS